MKSMKVARLGLIGAAVAVALLAGLVAFQVSAAAHRVDVHSGTAAPGATVSVDVGAHGIADPGLGAWRVRIEYDPAVVSVASCAPQGASVCNPAFDDTTVLVNGASASGLLGDNVLATIDFTCGASEGTSALTLTIDTLADATIGDPQDISSDATAGSGTITCEAAAEEPPAEEPPAEEPPPVLPEVGITGNSSSSGSAGWLIAGLAGMGLAVLAGFGALRLSSRRQ